MTQYIKTEDGYKRLEESISAVTDNKMDKTNPTGTGSFSMNRKAGTVIGVNSHAEGYSTTASGHYSHAEGYQTTVSGNSSHAEGNSTTAGGHYSHAEGYQTTASGQRSHAEGDQTTASGDYSHAEGSGNTASRDYSHAEGNYTTASGDVSHAEGFNTKASGADSHAEGRSTTASGQDSHAEGNNTTANGSDSHAEGISTTASGGASHAEGYSTNKFSSVVTLTNPTTDEIITAWEKQEFSLAKGKYSHVEGKDNLSLGDSSHAEGNHTTASGDVSHAEGNSTIASGGGSHAEGFNTTASEYYSHAEGSSTIASGWDSHAEGSHTIASGQGSHAEGSNTIASGDYSHAQGKLNIEDTSSIYADIIGNGTIVNGTMIKRSNAATVDWSGNAWFAGDVYTGSTSGTNKDDGSKKLATEEYVNSSIAANSVLYTAQSLTEEEQAQARANIGAQNLYNGLTPVSYSCTDGTYSVSDTVYLESGNIISPTDTVSNDVRVAFRFINLWNIPTQLDYWKNDIKKYKLLIDNGYLENNTIWYSKPDKKFKKQIRFATNSTLGDYIVFNFNYDYEVIGQLVYYVDTDTISTGTDTYLNHNLKRDKNNVLSYSAIKLSSDPTEPMQIATKQYVDNAITNIPATDLSNCVQTDKENILGDNGSIISNSSRGNNLTISNGVIEQKNGNQDTVSLGDAKVVFSHDNDGSSSTKGSGTFTMYGRKGEEYFKFKGTNGDVRVSGIATPTLSNDAVNKGYVDLQIANIEIPTVPTNVSAFTNDAGYLTAVPSEYITETELNAKGYLTEHQSLADYALKSEIPSPYSLPTASATALGGIKVGAGLAIADDGTLSMNIASAAVGQIIKVKAIDESGKPTAWEAANMQSGGSETWEKISDVSLTQDISSYILASFGSYRKIKIMMERGTYVSGLSKNVWVRTSLPGVNNAFYTVGYLTSEYGYLKWEVNTEVNNAFISGHMISSNNPNASATLSWKSSKELGDTAVSDLSLRLDFTDVSVIQDGDSVSVWGVRW